jgi:transcriptional regulator with XRE-family HTH domain
MTYGIKLRKMRIEKGYSQNEIADFIGLNQSTYCRIESDKLIPRADWIYKLSFFYKIDVGELYPPSL